MKFAAIDGERRAAEPGLKGYCPACEKEVIAKCGTLRIWHWAHRGKLACNSNKEAETEWHRAWKNQFANEYQEVVHFDQAGEKHIADVKTAHNLVIEFQHSPISPEERISREAFYENMVWIVNGTRRLRDRPRFLEEQSYWRRLGQSRVFVTHFPELGLPREWVQSTVPVFFDFDGLSNPETEESNQQQLLWCLLPKRVFGLAIIVAFPKQSFLKLALQRDKVIDVDLILGKVADHLDRQRKAHQHVALRSSTAWRQGARPWRQRARPWRPKAKPRKYSYRKRRKRKM